MVRRAGVFYGDLCSVFGVFYNEIYVFLSCLEHVWHGLNDHMMNDDKCSSIPQHIFVIHVSCQ